MLKNLGKRIRELRKTKGVTLVEMAEKTGVAQATLSRIETGTMTGTVESHEKISEVLGIGLAELYTGVDRRYDEVAHQSQTDKRHISHHTNDYQLELLTHESSQKKITPLMLYIQGEATTPEEKNERGVEKFFFLLEGDISVQIADSEYRLKEHETLYFDASLPHHIKNRSRTTSKVLITVSPSKI